MISNQNTSTDPQLSREEAIEILNTPDENLDELIARAEKLRRKYKGNHVSIHILTNARSGNCSQDCAYCAQSCRSKADIDKYKWVADEKLYADNDFVNEHHLSRHCIGLSGMKFTDAEIEELAEKIRKMKEQGTHLCCSIGFLTEKQALMLKEAGLDRINHNLNSSRAYYHNICSTHTFEQRVANINPLRCAGTPAPRGRCRTGLSGTEAAAGCRYFPAICPGIRPSCQRPGFPAGGRSHFLSCRELLLLYQLAGPAFPLCHAFRAVGTGL